MKSEQSYEMSVRVLGALHAWRETTVPVAMLLILWQAFAVPLARAEGTSPRYERAAAPAAAEVASLGTPGLDAVEPAGSLEPAGAMARTAGLTAADPPLPQVRNVLPRPEEATVSDERRAEVMEQARIRQLYFSPGTGERADAVVATNPPHGFDLAYSSNGMQISPRRLAAIPGAPVAPPPWEIRMRCEAVAFDGVDLPAEGAETPAADGIRASHEAAAGCTEWWMNGSDGLEHGFTVSRPATGGPPDRLEVTIRVKTALEIVRDAAAGEIAFLDERGRRKGVYKALHVFDADGAELESSMTLERAEGDFLIRLAAEVAGAEFPVTVDPVMATTEEETLAGDGAPGHEYGFSSDGHGDVLAVGAPGNGGGKVYLYHEDEGGPGEWDEVTAVVVPAAENPAGTDRFGESVAVFRDEATGDFHLAVGAPLHEGRGSVFIFGRNVGGSGNWGFVQAIQDADLAGGDLFGCSVDGLGGTLVVGAKGQNAGAVYIHEMAAGSFSRTQKLTPPATGPRQPGDEFGAAVAIGGDHLVIGAPGENSENGGAYLLKRSSPFVFLFRLFSDKSHPGARFGAAVAIAATGLLLAIGMPFGNVDVFGPVLANAGAVFIYAFLANTLAWGFVTGLFGSTAGALFGFSLALNFFHDLVVGAPGAPSVGAMVAGAVFVYLFNALQFRYTEAPTKVVPSSFIDPGMALGTSVVLLGTALFVLGAAYSAQMGAMFRFTLAATLLTFALWQQLFWTQDEIDNHPEITGPNADPDRDRLVNCLEFAMFLIPVIANRHGFRGAPAGDGSYRYEFRQSLVAAGVLLFLQYSQLLTQWFGLNQGPLAGSFAATRQHAGIQADQLQVTFPMAVAVLLFLRLRAEEVM